VTFRGTQDEIASLNIGDTLYHFDGNRRVYHPDRHSGPIYERHFELVVIIGETKLSWIMDRYKNKVNKKTLESACQFAERGYFTKAGMDADIWSHDHRHKIIDGVRHVDTERLKEIARILGYDATRP
jgi:hypothetical protein